MVTKWGLCTPCVLRDPSPFGMDPPVPPPFGTGSKPARAGSSQSRGETTCWLHITRRGHMASREYRALHSAPHVQEND